jgi:hypothetical protein
MADPFDLDAAEAEIARTPYTFVWGGREWTLANAFKLDLRVVMRGIEGDVESIFAALRAGLGEQADDFLGAPAEYDGQGTQTRPAVTPVKPLTLDAAKILFGRWTDHSGLDAGEPSGSSGSSKSTEEPSRPTSPATTASASTKPSSARRKTATRRGNSSTG